MHLSVWKFAHTQSQENFYWIWEVWPNRSSVIWTWVCDTFTHSEVISVIYLFKCIGPSIYLSAWTLPHTWNHSLVLKCTGPSRLPTFPSSQPLSISLLLEQLHTLKHIYPWWSISRRLPWFMCQKWTKEHIPFHNHVMRFGSFTQKCTEEHEPLHDLKCVEIGTHSVTIRSALKSMKLFMILTLVVFLALTLASPRI